MGNFSGDLDQYSNGPRKVETAIVARAGFASGSMMREKISKVPGIAHLEVKGPELAENHELYMKVEPTVPVADCRDCGKVSMQEHVQGDEQKVRDFSIADRRCWLLYRARRFRCADCQKTFVERVELLRRGMRNTTRYERHIYQRGRRGQISQIA
jgi:transposase